MNNMKYLYIICFCFLLTSESLVSLFAQSVHVAPAPLYRDPVTDGAADPVVVWNPVDKCWWMLYTQRRANLDAADVAYCYGTQIGVAERQIMDKRGYIVGLWIWNLRKDIIHFGRQKLYVRMVNTICLCLIYKE